MQLKKISKLQMLAFSWLKFKQQINTFQPLYSKFILIIHDLTVAKKKNLKLKKIRNMENTINNISQSDRKPSHQASRCPSRNHLRPVVVSRACVAPWSRSCRQGLWVVERPRLSVRTCPPWCSSFDSRDAQDAVCLYKGRQIQSTNCRFTWYHSYANQNLIGN